MKCVSLSHRLVVCFSLVLVPAIVVSAQEATLTGTTTDSTSAVQAPSDPVSAEQAGTAKPSLSMGSAFRGRPLARVFTPEADSTRVLNHREIPRPTKTLWALGDADPSPLLTQQPAATPPTPQHTGFKALLFETGADFKAFPRRTSTWVILGVGAGAAALALPIDDEVNAHLAGSGAVGRFYAPGKYLGSFPVQVGTAAGLYVIGRYVMPHAQGEPQTNKVSHLGFDLTRALIVSQALTQGVKLVFRKDRPTGECCGMPSGHAAAAFATAAVFERHLGYRGAWPTLVVATYIATSRLHDNVHFLSDVLFGSALGMASGWTVVGRHGRSSYAMVPTPTRGGMMLSLVRTVPPRR
jgi:membrane-associated phospholipid phosphatase